MHKTRADNYAVVSREIISWLVVFHSPLVITSPLGGVPTTAVNMSVCPLAYLRNHTADLHQIFSASGDKAT